MYYIIISGWNAVTAPTVYLAQIDLMPQLNIFSCDDLDLSSLYAGYLTNRFVLHHADHMANISKSSSICSVTVVINTTVPF